MFIGYLDAHLFLEKASTQFYKKILDVNSNSKHNIGLVSLKQVLVFILIKFLIVFCFLAIDLVKKML